MLEPVEDARLGRGSFGEVQKVRRKGTNKIYALKTIKKSDVIEGNLTDQVEREIEVQKKLKHKNVLRLYQHFEDADCVYLLLEFCAQGELYQIMRTRKGRRFPEALACKYFLQVAEGLRYLHSKKIVHRDIKPENLLVNDKDQVKIADFGWCAILQTPRTTFCGTLDYLAPEMIQGSGHDHTLDLWGLGVLLYEMIAGKPPFQSTNHGQLIQKILHLDLRPNPQMSEQLVHLIRALLRKEPHERLPLDKVMVHPWVRQQQNVELTEPNRDGSFGYKSSEEGSRASGTTVAFSTMGSQQTPQAQSPRGVRSNQVQVTREACREVAHLATPRLLARDVDQPAPSPRKEAEVVRLEPEPGYLASPATKMRSPLTKPTRRIGPVIEEERRVPGPMTPPAPPPPPARIAVQLSPAPEYREVPRHTDSPAPLSQSSSLVNIAVPSVGLALAKRCYA
jgi:serine/threonine protein kinase